jgi:hypothetical protein
LETQNAASVPADGPGQLVADSIRYAGDTIILQAEEGRTVRVESGTARITARNIEVNVAQKQIRARGNVLIENTRVIQRRMLAPEIFRDRRVGQQMRSETVTEMLMGSNLNYDYQKQTGQIDDASVSFESFDIESARITVNGTRYIAENVLLRPGGLSEEERKIYGTPPFNFRVRRLVIDNRRTARGVVPSVSAKGAAIYYKNTRLLPVPSYVFRTAVGTALGPSRDRAAFGITPVVAYNSTDGLLATLQLGYPLATDPRRGVVSADIGLSQKIGFRGGLQYTASSRIGDIIVQARNRDFVTTQLSNRIQLDRLPEFQFESRVLPIFRSKRGFGLGVSGLVNAGRYTERFKIDGGYAPSITSSRLLATVALTTRITDADGPYFDLFRSVARYTTVDQRYNNSGFEIGYAGNLGSRIRGLFSYRDNDISGNTPFRFDEIEISRELRTTFDYQLSPRYLIPIDLRYDLDQKRFRDETVGILRSYKTFAYGVTYQFSRSELRLDFRSGF